MIFLELDSQWCIDFQNGIPQEHTILEIRHQILRHEMMSEEDIIVRTDSLKTQIPVAPPNTPRSFENLDILFEVHR